MPDNIDIDVLVNMLKVLLMLGDISKAEKIYIATGYTDMRKSIDGLAAIVQQNFHLESMFQILFSSSVGKKFLKIKGTLLGRRWFRPALQETGKWKIQMA